MLGIRSEEKPLVAWMVAFFLVVQSSHGLAANAADALFFLRFGVDRLPLMIMLSGVAVMVFILAHSTGLAYRGPARWLRTATLVCSAWAAVEWLGAQVDSRSVYPVIWISTQVIMMVTLTVMWNAAGAACTTRQAKRLFPLFATAGVAGGVLGNLLTGPLAAFLGTENLLLVQAALLLGGAGLLAKVRTLFTDDEIDPPSSIIREITATVSTVWSTKFLRMAAVIAIAMFCLFYLVYFPFSESVASSFETEEATAGFLGVFSSVATAATFLFSLFVTNRLFARLGLVVSLMIVPVVYAAGFGIWLIGFTLASAALVRGLQWVTVNAIGVTAFNALFNVVTGRRRGQMVAFMTAVPAQIGVSLAGVLLVVTADAAVEVMFLVGLGLSLLMLVMVIRLRGAYLGAVVSAVRHGVVGIFDAPAHGVVSPTDADARRVLVEHLGDPRPKARALAVAGLARFGDAAAAVEPLLGDVDPLVRSAAFDTVCVIDPGRVSHHASKAVGDEVPEVRLQVLQYLAAHPEDNGAPLAEKALTDPDARVRAAAACVVGGKVGEDVIASLLADPDPRAVAAALAETSRPASTIAVDPTPFLDHDSALVRSAAAAAFGNRNGEPAALRPGLDDRSPSVRRASASALAASAGGREILMDVLATGSVSASEAALRELTPVEELADDFTMWARSEAERAARLMAYARTLQGEEHSPSGQYLLSVLRMRTRRLVDWVLLAMTTPETRAVMPIVARGVRSTDPETQSQAIEALETVGARQVLSVLLPLLESDGSKPPPSRERALDELSADFDPWLKTLASRALAETEGSAADVSVPSLSVMEPMATPRILSAMDKVLALQRVHMFSELDPEDLDLIARATTESSYEPAAPVYLRGEPGEELLLIVEGSAVVTTGEGSERRLIETYGPGEQVGELALLTGGARSADVHAGEEGLRGLALSNSDLMSVLEERPAVSLGMLGTLAKRLIEQT